LLYARDGERRPRKGGSSIICARKKKLRGRLRGPSRSKTEGKGENWKVQSTAGAQGEALKKALMGGGGGPENLRGDISY